MNNGSVDDYLRDGCGRCDHYRTPACKVHPWAAALEALRAQVLACGLDEQLKWGSPTYSVDDKNVVMIVAMTEYCALSFFQGVALEDPAGLLEAPGPNSRFARYVKFTAVDEVVARRPHVDDLLQQAIALRRAGHEIVLNDGPPTVPAELAARLDADPALERAFAALTPGRQRSHILYVEGAKQSATRHNRAERCADKIFAGKGFNER